MLWCFGILLLLTRASLAEEAAAAAVPVPTAAGNKGFQALQYGYLGPYNQGPFPVADPFLNDYYYDSFLPYGYSGYGWGGYPGIPLYGAGWGWRGGLGYGRGYGHRLGAGWGRGLGGLGHRGGWRHGARPFGGRYYGNPGHPGYFGGYRGRFGVGGRR